VVIFNRNPTPPKESTNFKNTNVVQSDRRKGKQNASEKKRRKNERGGGGQLSHVGSKGTRPPAGESPGTLSACGGTKKTTPLIKKKEVGKGKN